MAILLRWARSLVAIRRPQMTSPRHILKEFVFGAAEVPGSRRCELKQRFVAGNSGRAHFKQIRLNYSL